MRLKFVYLLLFLTGILHSQQYKDVDFTRATAEVLIDPEKRLVYGAVKFELKIINQVDSIYIDARNMDQIQVVSSFKDVDFNYNGERVVITDSFQQGKTYSYNIAFGTKPKKAMYFVGWDNDAPDQVWTQGQGKYTSNWLPSFDEMNQKLIWQINYKVPGDYEVIANGSLENSSRYREQDGELWTNWYYEMDKPMPSYLLAVVVGKYKKEIDYSESGIPLLKYYYPADSLKVEPTYRYTKEIFDFLENEIGVTYPWRNYKQIPVHDFMYAGMENTGTTIFSDSYVIDENMFLDQNYISVNAHEMAHQWFGNMVTASSGTHQWLQEGFATYYSLLTERHLFGDDHFYWKLYESALHLEDQDLSGGSTSLLNPNSSSLTFYQKGAWTLFMLRELVGDFVFQASVRDYLREFGFKNAETEDFLSIVETNGKIDLENFKYEWFEKDDFPIERALDALKQNSKFIQEYLMVDCEVDQSKCNQYLSSGISDEAKLKVISQSPDKITAETFEESWRVRQGIAQNLKSIPADLKSQYESLLKDKSYVTREAALYNLYLNFPENRVKYLKAVEGVSMEDYYSLRQLYIGLHLGLPDFETERKQKLITELKEATTEVFDVQTRMSAFNYLRLLNLCDSECIIDLQHARSHHNWRMVKFAKNQLSLLNQE